MSRSQLLGWTTLACAVAALAFHWHSPPASHADPGGDPETPRQAFRKVHSTASPSQATPGGLPRHRVFPRPDERVPHATPKPAKPADFGVSVPEGTPEDVAATARWIDTTARKRLQEMTDRYRLTPAQQERVFPILARNLPGYSEQMTVSPIPRGGFAGTGLTETSGRITPRSPNSTAHPTRNTNPGATDRSRHPASKPGSPAAGSPGRGVSQPGTHHPDSSVKRPHPTGDSRQPGSPGDHQAPPTLAEHSSTPTGSDTNPGSPQALQLPPPTLEDELFALLDPDQQALMMDDSLDSDRWWHEIIGQLESELNDIISSGLPSTQPDSPSEFDAPDDNLFDLLGN